MLLSSTNYGIHETQPRNITNADEVSPTPFSFLLSPYSFTNGVEAFIPPVSILIL